MPAMAVESGPAAGVVAAALVARQTGRGNLLSFDMGGTTAKASLIRDGQYETTPEYEVGGGSSRSRWMHGTGHPIRVSVIDLAEVSAGGGSIAWVDRAGSLRVGPQERRRRSRARVLRAAAAPSPPSPTATCCSAISTRARCSPATCRSTMRPRRPPSASAWPSRWASMPRTAAAAVIDVVNHAMARGAQDRLRAARPRSARVRARSLRRGRAAARRRAGRRARHRRDRLPADPRRLLGARPDRHGPQARLRAHRLRHDRERRPREPRSRVRRAGERGRRHARPRRHRARSAAASSAPSTPATSASPTSCRCRCRRARSMPRILAEIAEAFHDRHRATYGHDNRGEPVQLVSVRLTAVGEIAPLMVRDRTAPAGTDADQEPARGVVPPVGRGHGQRLRPPAHACRADGAGPRRHRIAGIDHSRPAGLAGQDDRRRLRGARARFCQGEGP